MLKIIMRINKYLFKYRPNIIKIEERDYSYPHYFTMKEECLLYGDRQSKIK